jgi:head-tail adaptor
VIPYTGMTAIQSENEQLEANVSAGLRVESDITSNFSILVDSMEYSMQFFTGFHY